MFRNNSQLNKQNERIRTLEQQLEAKERELADQKWVFEQFLQSPSWKLTAPIRWLARQLRKVRAWLSPHPAASGGPPSPSGRGSRAESARGEETNGDHEPEQIDAASDWKEFFTAFQRVQLQTLLSSNARIDLPNDPNPEISILLVLFNRAELTLACLRSIQENRSHRLQVVIVDNASSDDTPALLDRVEGARIIRSKENLNFNEGVRRAAHEATGENLLILNNDAQLMPGTLEAALTTLRSSPDIGAVGAKIILLDGSLQEAGSIVWRDGSCLGYGRGDDPFAPMYMFRRDVDYCSGAFVLTSRAIWQRFGGFDEVFKPMYYEETDYCTRLWENGFRVVYEPRAIIVHYEFASSTTTQSATELQRKHQQLFVSRHEALLSGQYSPEPNAILPARIRDRGRKRILFLEDRIPHNWLGSGFPRAQTILRALLKHGYFVTYYPLSIYDEDWSTVYWDLPLEVEIMAGYGPQLLEAFLRNRRDYYHTILVSRPHNMKILQTVMNGYPAWFENVNLIYDAEALFAARDISLRALTGSPFSAEEISRITKEEVDLAAASDCVISVSQYEREAFRRHGVERCEVLGHSLQPHPTPATFEDRNGFLFVGAIYEEASPNGDAVIWFLSEVYPRIQSALGNDVPVTIVGVNQSDRIRCLAGGSVRILGFMRDITDLYNSARVFVAPTRYAAGIPHKVHEAAARGLPAVATPLLADQLGWKDGDPFAVGVDAESFAKKCIELHTNQALWMRFREAGLARIRTECSQSEFESRVKEIFEVSQSPAGRSNPDMSGANASPVGRSNPVRFADVGMDG